MTSRERFLLTMRLGNPDRVPLFEEGIRDSVLHDWREQGLPPGKDIQQMFQFDRREEIDTNLEHGLDLARLSEERSGLDRLREKLESNDPSRLGSNWSNRTDDWSTSEHVLMLRVHEGFFLSMGVEDWDGFSDAIYLLKDKPDFVREALTIQGEFSAKLAERVLQDVQIDAAVFSEPIGGNHGPLISPQMYHEFMHPSFTPVLDVLRRFGVENIIYRTYANSRILIPGIMDLGFNCLWAVERNSQEMDYLELRREFGPRLRLIGGIDRDVLRHDKGGIKRELEDKVPPLLVEGGYIPLADGRIREDVPFENYLFYRRLLEHISRNYK